MPTSRPIQTRKSLAKDRQPQECFKKCGRMRMPGRSYCYECHNESNRIRRQKKPTFENPYMTKDSEYNK